MLRTPIVSLVLHALVAGSLGVPAPSAVAQVRRDVLLQTTQTTSVGQSIYVLGDLPELGGWDMTRAVKMDPSGYPVWRVNVALPAGRAYTYRIVRRSDGPGQTSQASNGVFLTENIAGVVPPPGVSTVPASKTLLLTWDVPGPVLRWRPATAASEATAPFTPRPMQRFGLSLNGRTQDTVWLAWGFSAGGEAYDFYFTDGAGASRYPPSGWYTTRLDGAFVQEGQVYPYVPAASVSPARRDYSPSSVPTLFSPQLNENRGYRVFLPRGYDQHPDRRYPVLYMHDGQNVFESGPFGSWNAATTVASLQAQGALREIIVVGLDNGPDRLQDYTPASDLGDGGRYTAYVRDTVMPRINAQYRTLTGPASTGALGSSMGGLISLSMGWEQPGVFGRIGAMSGAWQRAPVFLSSVQSGAARDIRVYLDSGDSGVATDNYWPTFSIRDGLVGTGTPRYALEGTLRHRVGYGQVHNEAAWAARLPECLTFLFPAHEEPSAVLSTVFNPSLDVDASGVVDLDDLYAWALQPRDLNLDGVSDGADAGLLERFLRRDEIGGMSAGQR
jgi:predicted alpha/beta superfamily hydrolase